MRHPATAQQQAGQLSTGQRRLVELARLAGEFDVLLLDEPSSGLDHAETERFGDVLTRVVAERGVGILLVEHDMALVMEVCELHLRARLRRLIFEGTPGEVARERGRSGRLPRDRDGAEAARVPSDRDRDERRRCSSSHGIDAGYGDTTVLRDCRPRCPDGPVVALLGPNGAGKTTLLRVASGLARSRRRAGRCSDGKDVTKPRLTNAPEPGCASSRKDAGCTRR